MDAGFLAYRKSSNLLSIQSIYDIIMQIKAVGYMNAVSLFCGAGGMDVGFEKADVNVVWANELDKYAIQTYRANHPNAIIQDGDIRDKKKELLQFKYNEIDLVFGGPPCQGFSVAGKMDPNDERSKLIWEYFDVVEIIQPKYFVMENVKALGLLPRWENVRQKIIQRAGQLGYKCFYRVLNAVNYGVPQKRERVFFIGMRNDICPENIEQIYDKIIADKRKSSSSLRECLVSLGKVGTKINAQTCTAKITLAIKPVLRKSPYAGMLFNGMGRPLDLDAHANTLPASMGGNKTPIVDELLLYDPLEKDWLKEYHSKLLNGENSVNFATVPEYFRRLTITEAAAIQTFPPNYIFFGTKSVVYRQIGNAVPCELAGAVASAIVIINKLYTK